MNRSSRLHASAVLPGTIAAIMGGKLRRLLPLVRRPLISVVIPCYNYGRYLRACVDSVCTNQDGVDLDIIIVDDRSTDDSLSIAHGIASTNPSVRVIEHAENTGAITTYNDGLSLARGDYVVLLSADDLLAPGALPRAAGVMEMEPWIGMVYGRTRPFFDHPPIAQPGAGDWIHWPGSDWLRIRCQSGYNVIASPEVMMRTSLLRRIGLYRTDLPHAGDLEMWLRAATHSDIAFLVGADQAFYRKHQANMHKTTFKSGSHDGALVDLEQRWQAFEVALRQSDDAAHLASLLRLARGAIARHAIQYSNYAFARGSRDFPFAAFESLAKRARPDVADSADGRSLARRKRLRMMPALPLHPLLAPAAISLRLVELGRRFRRSRTGV